MITAAISVVTTFLISAGVHPEAPKVRCDMRMERWCLTPFPLDISISKKKGLVHWNMGTPNDGFSLEESIDCRQKNNERWSLSVSQGSSDNISRYVMKSGLCTITIGVSSAGSSMRTHLRYVENGILFNSGSDYVTIGELKRSAKL
ncbi:MAG: hypothetical protein H2054_07435 [Sphingomonas sp.]|nr:hypothetical protein [Sphingomonas sp.]